MRGFFFSGLFVFGVLALVLTGCRAKSAQRSDAQPHSVSLAWAASAPPAAGYNVYRSNASGGPYTKLNLMPINTNKYTDSNVQAGQTYFYVVTTVDSKNAESPYSKEVSAKVPAK